MNDRVNEINNGPVIMNRTKISFFFSKLEEVLITLFDRETGFLRKG